MELAFDTLQLRTWCEDPDHTLSSVKPQVVEPLKNRLADLRVADSPLDLVAGSPRLINSRPPRVTILLGAGYSLNCVVNHNEPRLDHDGRIDWRRVRRLRITSIKEVGK